MFLLKDTTQWHSNPRPPRSRVKHSTTEPLCSPTVYKGLMFIVYSCVTTFRSFLSSCRWFLDHRSVLGSSRNVQLSSRDRGQGRIYSEMNKNLSSAAVVIGALWVKLETINFNIYLPFKCKSQQKSFAFVFCWNVLETLLTNSVDPNQIWIYTVCTFYWH